MKNNKVNMFYKWFHKKTKMRFWRIRHLWNEVVYFGIIVFQYYIVSHLIDNIFSLDDMTMLLVTALFLNKKLLN